MKTVLALVVGFSIGVLFERFLVPFLANRELQKEMSHAKARRRVA